MKLKEALEMSETVAQLDGHTRPTPSAHLETLGKRYGVAFHSGTYFLAERDIGEYKTKNYRIPKAKMKLHSWFISLAERDDWYV